MESTYYPRRIEYPQQLGPYAEIIVERYLPGLESLLAVLVYDRG